MGRSLIAFVALSLLSFCLYTDAAKLSIGTDESLVDNVVKDGAVSESWEAGRYISPCKPTPTQGPGEGGASLSFYLRNGGDTSLVISSLEASSEDPSVMRPKWNPSSLTLAPGQRTNVTLSYGCTLSSDSPYSVVTALIRIDGEDNSVRFSWVKVCEISSRFNWSVLVTFLMAVLTVAAGAYMHPDDSNPAAVSRMEEEPVNEVETHHGLLFVAGGSIALMVLFFFITYLSIVLTIMISFSSTIALLLLLDTVAEKIIPTRSPLNRAVRLPWLGPVPIITICLFFVSLGIVIAYVITRLWPLNNILGIALVLLFLRSFRMSSIKVASALLILAFFYDIFWVFLSSKIFGKNVMVTVAQSVDLPLKLEIPQFGPSANFACSMIGLGDLVLPGLLVTFARRLDLHLRAKVYFPSSLVSYVVGLALCGFFMVVFDAAQPALLYLVPCCLGTVTFLGFYRGELSLLWQGIKASPPPQASINESEELLSGPRLSREDEGRHV